MKACEVIRMLNRWWILAGVSITTMASIVSAGTAPSGPPTMEAVQKAWQQQNNATIEVRFSVETTMRSDKQPGPAAGVPADDRDEHAGPKWFKAPESGSESNAKSRRDVSEGVYIRTPEVLYAKKLDGEEMVSRRTGLTMLKETRTRAQVDGKPRGTVNAVCPETFQYSPIETVLYPMLQRKDDRNTAFLYGWLKYGKIADEPEMVDGHKCWRIDANTGEAALDDLKIWVDQGAGWCPRKIEMTQRFRASGKKGSSITTVQMLDYDEISSGVWFPRKVLSDTTRRLDGELHVSAVYKATELRGDRKYRPDDLLFAFPCGCEVKEAQSGPHVKYADRVADGNGKLLVMSGESIDCNMCCQCASRYLQSIQAYKPGMTRADLDRDLTTEGGIYTRHQRRYVWRECPCLKVDVEFDWPAEEDGLNELRPTDVIVKVSQPYLQGTVTD